METLPSELQTIILYEVYTNNIKLHMNEFIKGALVCKLWRDILYNHKLYVNMIQFIYAVRGLPLGALRQCIFGALDVYSSTFKETIIDAKIPKIKNIEIRDKTYMTISQSHGVKILHGNFTIEIGYNIYPIYKVCDNISKRDFSTTMRHNKIVNKYKEHNEKFYNKKSLDNSNEILMRPLGNAYRAPY